MKLWAAVESCQVRFSTDGVVAEIEHAKAAQREPEILRRECSDLGDKVQGTTFNFTHYHNY